MESRFAPTTDASNKKKYCDKSFKNSLCKALTVNYGDPDNINKINAFKNLEEYPASRIVEYTNALSSDIQNVIEDTIEDPEVKNIIKLAKNMESFTKYPRKDEIKSVTKLLSESEKTENYKTTSNVDFNLLNKYIHSAVSGLPDVTPLNVSSRDVLFGAYKVLMEQVDKDATPQFLDNLKHTLIHGEDTSMNTKFAELSKCLNHPSLNPLALPFSYMINGVLPDDTNNEQTDIEMGNETTEASSKPENNTQFSFSKSTTIRDENKSGSEEISSDEPEDEETEPTKSKKTKVSRRSKNTKTKNRIVL